jgi:hypothetical protein
VTQRTKEKVDKTGVLGTDSEFAESDFLADLKVTAKSKTGGLALPVAEGMSFRKLWQGSLRIIFN